MTALQSTGHRPEDLAQRQLDAYNAKDLDAFCACYSPDVQVFRMPATAPVTSGLAAFRERYRTGPFAQPQVQAEVRTRVVMGSKVLDHEFVHGRGADPQQVFALYEVQDGLITTVWFFQP